MVLLPHLMNTRLRHTALFEHEKVPQLSVIVNRHV